ncbi:hypothetical protein [Microbacterium sp.]|uniref:hypothetical protein n=1 Tax=Microbacterium sp. TaxID=51671 RepID=UPI003C78E5B7
MHTVFARPPKGKRPPKLASDDYYGSGFWRRPLNTARAWVARCSAPLRHFAYGRSEDGRRTSAVINELHDSQRGLTGVIVCNGPSIANTDLALLAGRPHIVLNRGYLLEGHVPTPPTILCVHDPLVLSQFGKEISRVPCPIIAHTHGRKDFSRRDGVAFLQSSRTWRFATRLGLSSHHGATVTFWALETAFHLGWDKVLIVGMDHTFPKTTAPSTVEVIRGSDRFHFSADYYPPGTKLLTPDVEAIEYSYMLARSAWESAGRRVVDCTVGGACTIFPKGDLKEELLASSGVFGAES